MKFSSFACIVFSLLAFVCVAGAQPVANYRAIVDLTTVSPGSNMTYFAYAGVLQGVSCRVTAPVTGSPIAGFNITPFMGSPFTLGGGFYNYSNQWGTVGFASSGSGGGANVGDYFYYPIGVGIPVGGLAVQYSVSNPAYTGAMVCNAYVTNSTL